MDEDPRRRPSGGSPPSDRQPLAARLLGGGVSGARTVAGATGLDRAVESVTEEALVRAIESEAVERALVRVLQGPVVEEAVQGALESEAVERALVDALDSELVDHVWRRLLASDEAQLLVERIAQAPEVRSAISAQGVGFVEDIGREVRRIARHLDTALERIARGLLRRGRRQTPSDRAGGATRLLALALDGLILNALFAGFTALLALIVSSVGGDSGSLSYSALVVGTAAWIVFGAAYLVTFWTLAGQTPGMRFLGIRLICGGRRRLQPRTAFRRLVGMVLALIPLGLGFLGILSNDQRLGWQDRFAHTEVLYESLEPREAPHSRA